MNVDVSNHASSQIPQELCGPLPRNVRMRADHKRGFAYLAILLLIAGGVYVAWNGFSALQHFKVRAALRTSGQIATGTVTLVERQRLWTTLEYKFAVNGVGYSGSADPRDGIQENDKIAIRYLPSNPAMNHPADWEWSVAEEAQPMINVVLISLLVFWGYRKLSRERTLARKGIPAEAVVRGCTRDRNGLHVAYEFYTEGRVLTPGSSDCKEVFQPGQIIWILYLPGNPDKNLPYPLSDYEIVG